MILVIFLFVLVFSTVKSIYFDSTCLEIQEFGGRAGCDDQPCQSAVCNESPECCHVSWSADCVSLAQVLCPFEYFECFNDTTSSQCSGNGFCSQSGYCVCFGNWNGSQCQMCPSPFSRFSDCRGCLNPNMDPSSDCTTCLGSFYGPNCQNCPSDNFDLATCSSCNSNFEIASNCSTCSGYYVGADCSFCPNNFQTEICELCVGNFDLASGCQHCIIGYDDTKDCEKCAGFWYGSDCQNCPVNFNPDCTKCVDESWDLGAACTQRKDCSGYWYGAQCEKCGENFNQECTACVNAELDVLSGCTRCTNPNRDISDLCSSCLGYWFGSDCNLCPSSNFDSECSGCSGNYDVGSFCVDCLPLWMGSECETCRRNENVKSNCSGCVNEFLDDETECLACLNPYRDIETQCVSCRNYYYGLNCSRCSAFYDDTECLHCRDFLADPSYACQQCYPNTNAACTDCIGSNWNISERCQKCNGNFDIDQDCSICNPGFSGPTCETCNENFETGCSKCNPRYDIASGCTSCVPGNFNITNNCECLIGFSGPLCSSCDQIIYNSECTACRNESLGFPLCVLGLCTDYWQGPNCDDCPSNFDPLCSSCVGNYDIASQCSVCLPHFDPATNCQTCVDMWFGNECSQCPVNADPVKCDKCLSIRFDETTHCTTCADFWSGVGCDQCDVVHVDQDGLCDKCVNDFLDASTKCTSCKSSHFEFASSLCRECSDFWEGSNCDICPRDLNEQCTDCRDENMYLHSSPPCNFMKCENEFLNPVELCRECINPNREFSSTTKCETCKNNFYGTSCEICPTRYEQSECNECAISLADPSTGCNECFANTIGDSACSDCLPNYDITTNCEKCVSNHERDDNCETCKQGFSGPSCEICNENFVPGCIECKDRYEISTGCTTCVASRFDPLNNCDCSGGFFGTECEQCDVTIFNDECDGCRNPRKVDFPICSTCGDYWTLSDCSLCASPNFDADCRRCDGNWDIDELCWECIKGYSKEDECKSCSGMWFGSNCDRCPPNADPVTCDGCRANFDPQSPDCLECINFWSGPNCDFCDPKFFIQDESCDKCSNEYLDPNAKCSGCKSGSNREYETSNCLSCSGFWQGSQCTDCPIEYSQVTCDRCKHLHQNPNSVPVCSKCYQPWYGSDCEVFPRNPNVNPIDNTCVNEYLNITTGCISCLNPNRDVFVQCRSCRNNFFGSKCLLCPERYEQNDCSGCARENFDKNYGCNSCVDGFWVDSDDECVGCNVLANCSKCESASSCTECRSNLFLANNGFCCTDRNCEICENGICGVCKIGVFMNPVGECVNCDDEFVNCEECTETECTRCKSGDPPKAGVCCSDRNCEKCDNSNSGLCEICSENYYLDQSWRCVLCANFLHSCEKCENKSTCLQCSSSNDTFLQNGNCCNEDTCELCSSSSGICYECKEGNYLHLSSSTCATCGSSLIGCEGCDLYGTRCLECAEGFMLRQDGYCCQDLCLRCGTVGECHECVDGYYVSPSLRICVDCQHDLANCENCVSEHKCVKCSNDTYLRNFHCCVDENCRGCDKNGVCQNCNSGYFVDNDECRTCDSELSGCDECLDNNTCVSCATDHQKLLNGHCCDSSDVQCIECEKTGGCSSCEIGYYVRDEKCVPCSENCVDCLVDDVCVECEIGYLLNSSIGKCEKCRIFLQNCDDCRDVDTCVSCDDDISFLQNGHCCEEVNCTSCDGKGICQECATGLFVDSDFSCEDCVENPEFCSCEDKESRDFCQCRHFWGYNDDYCSKCYSGGEVVDDSLCICSGVREQRKSYCDCVREPENKAVFCDCKHVEIGHSDSFCECLGAYESKSFCECKEKIGLNDEFCQMCSVESEEEEEVEIFCELCGDNEDHLYCVCMEEDDNSHTYCEETYFGEEDDGGIHLAIIIAIIVGAVLVVVIVVVLVIIAVILCCVCCQRKKKKEVDEDEELVEIEIDENGDLVIGGEKKTIDKVSEFDEKDGMTKSLKFKLRGQKEVVVMKMKKKKAEERKKKIIERLERKKKKKRKKTVLMSDSIRHQNRDLEYGNIEKISQIGASLRLTLKNERGMFENVDLENVSEETKRQIVRRAQFQLDAPSVVGNSIRHKGGSEIDITKIESIVEVPKESNPVGVKSIRIVLSKGQKVEMDVPEALKRNIVNRAQSVQEKKHKSRYSQSIKITKSDEYTFTDDALVFGDKSFKYVDIVNLNEVKKGNRFIRSYRIEVENVGEIEVQVPKRDKSFMKTLLRKLQDST